MKCDLCGGNTTLKTGQKYHYTESGLHNVFLENVEVFVCESCGSQIPCFRRIKDLHDAIGRAIALQPAPLTGSSLRFLRKHLGLKARAWAPFLRIDTSTLSRWENGEQQIGPQSDILIRLIYFRLLEERNGQRIPEALTQRIAAIPFEREREPIVIVSMDNPFIYSYHCEIEAIAER